MHGIDKWEKAEALYKVGVPVTTIGKEVGIVASQIYERIKKQGWRRYKPKKPPEPKTTMSADQKMWEEIPKTVAGARIIEEIKAKQTLKEIEDWKNDPQTKPMEVKVHDKLVLDRLTLEEAFASSAVRNQRLSDSTVFSPDRESAPTIDELKKHAETTKINKSIVLGSDAVIIKGDQDDGDKKYMVAMPASMMAKMRPTQVEAIEDNE